MLHGDDAALRSHQRSFYGDAGSPYRENGIPQLHLKLGHNDRADLTADIADGTGAEPLIVKADLVGAPIVLIDDEHGGGGVDAPVDHVLKLIVLDGAGGLTALVVEDVAVPETGVPHIIEDVGVTGIGQHHDLTGGLHRRDQIFVLTGDIQNEQGGEIQLVIFRKVAEPAKNGGIAKIGTVHNDSSLE